MVEGKQETAHLGGVWAWGGDLAGWLAADRIQQGLCGVGTSRWERPGLELGLRHGPPLEPAGQWGQHTASIIFPPAAGVAQTGGGGSRMLQTIGPGSPPLPCPKCQVGVLAPKTRRPRGGLQWAWVGSPVEERQPG